MTADSNGFNLDALPAEHKEAVQAFVEDNARRVAELEELTTKQSACISDQGAHIADQAQQISDQDRQITGQDQQIAEQNAFLTSDIFSYKSLILLCLGWQKALHGLFSPAIVSEC
ncbi:hypothetical protein [Ruegeria sp.]|uniref:hypothetical protein n=1 Tax=Ruegeria sp. TaxID=1879320 RepID=UPI003B006C7A